MVDRDKVEGLIRHLRQYTTYYLQVSIETCINIENHIIATEKLRAPKDYKDSFKVLNEAGILSDDLTQVMRELAGLRNLLVHLYWDIDDQMIYDGIRSELGDFEAFIDDIVNFLDRSA
jgi:uncharacterized protein YutE (UPF0331/DUF86 family)